MSEHKDPLKYPNLQDPYEKTFLKSYSKSLGEGTGMIFGILKDIEKNDTISRSSK